MSLLASEARTAVFSSSSRAKRALIFPELSEDYFLCECSERYLVREHSEH